MGWGVGMDERKLRKIMEKVVEPNVVDELLRRGEISEGGKRQEVTVMFTDIRGFTSMSESLPPEEVVKKLNWYFDVVVDAVVRHGGTVDKYVGDAVMALFNAPKRQEDHALRAVRAAIEIEKTVAASKSDLKLGVSIASGVGIVGVIGCRHFVDYTVIGEVANIASRMQDVLEGGEIGLNDEALSLVDGEVKAVDERLVQFKGKSVPVRVHVVGY